MRFNLMPHHSVSITQKSLIWRESDSFSVSSNREMLAFKHSSTDSQAIKRHFSYSTTTAVVFEPANGSITRSLRSVSSSMKNLGKETGEARRKR